MSLVGSARETESDVFEEETGELGRVRVSLSVSVASVVEEDMAGVWADCGEVWVSAIGDTVDVSMDGFIASVVDDVDTSVGSPRSMSSFGRSLTDIGGDGGGVLRSKAWCTTSGGGHARGDIMIPGACEGSCGRRDQIAQPPNGLVMLCCGGGVDGGRDDVSCEVDAEDSSGSWISDSCVSVGIVPICAYEEDAGAGGCAVSAG